MTNRPDRSGQTLGLEFVLDLWTRRKWVVLVVFAAAFSAAASLAVWLPNLYRATAIVLVETQHVSEELVRSSVSAELGPRIETIRQQVMSRARLTDLIAQLDLYPDLRKKGVPLIDIIERMRRDIDLTLNDVSPAGGRGPTIAFEISYGGRDPETIARVANVLASLYVEENTKIREGQATRTAEFLKAQLANVKEELDAQDRRRSEFSVTHVGELPEQVAANLVSLDRLNTQLRLNGDSQVRSMDRRDRLERELADTESAAPGATASAASTPAGAELANLRRQLDELKRKFTDQYPDVVRLRIELADLERQLSERPPAPATATAMATDSRARLRQGLSNINAELESLKREELALRRAISSYEERVDNAPKRQEEFLVLSRDYDAIKDRYATMLKRYEEAQLASSLEQGQKIEQFRILDAAIPPRNPAAPNRLRLLFVGFIFSIGLAVGAVLLAEKVDTSFHSLDDLRAFVSVPTLFSIPRLLTTADYRGQWLRRAVTVVSIAIGLALIIAGSRYVATGNEQIVRFTAGRRL